MCNYENPKENFHKKDVFIELLKETKLIGFQKNISS